MRRIVATPLDRYLGYVSVETGTDPDVLAVTVEFGRLVVHVASETDEGGKGAVQLFMVAADDVLPGRMRYLCTVPGVCAHGFPGPVTIHVFVAVPHFTPPAGDPPHA